MKRPPKNSSPALRAGGRSVVIGLGGATPRTGPSKSSRSTTWRNRTGLLRACSRAPEVQRSNAADDSPLLAMVRTVTLSGLRCPTNPHRLYSHSTSFGHMTTMLNTFTLVCSDVLENQISLRKIKISCNLVHPGGKKTVLQWPCAPCGAMFEY